MSQLPRLLAGLIITTLFTGSCSNRFEDCETTSRCPSERGRAGGGAGRGGGSGEVSEGGSESGASGEVGGGSSAGHPSSGGGGGPSGGAPMSGSGGESGESGASGSGGAAGSGGGSPPECDESLSPREEHCIVEQGLAIFVSPSGTNTASGTSSAPVKTLARAVELARRESKPVVACTGVYAESITLQGDEPVRVYGGFACSDPSWPLSTGKSVIAPGSGVALSIQDVPGEVALEGLEFRSANATGPGESSIAALISDSPNVTLRDTKLVAGDGRDGALGKTENFAFEGMKDGNAATGTTGGAAKTCTCPAGDTTTGGKGGSGALAQDGDDGLPDYGGGRGGLASNAPECGSPTDSPRSGFLAPNPPALGEGAKTHGTWTNDTFRPSPGTAGAPGSAGQGGGGGRGGSQGGGGGGACGGCGGKGGGAGGGGGASLALVVLDSSVTLEAVELVTGKAGQGGAGALGQEGQAGGFGTAGTPSACQGGDGAPGTAGAPGGGGAGGLSVGILYRGPAPTLRDLEYSLGPSGAGGPGGDAADPASQGLDGIQTEHHEIP